MADSPRLFTPVPIRAGAEIIAPPGQAHYLGTVLRRRPGDAVRLFNGTDGEWSARIVELRRDHARCTVEARLREPLEEPDLWLVFALLKRDATDLVVQKATELGASAILPVFTTRTTASRVNLERLAAIATEAAEQSERLTVPRIAPARPLSALLADWPAERRLIAAVERAHLPALGTTTGTAIGTPRGEGTLPSSQTAGAEAPSGVQRRSDADTAAERFGATASAYVAPLAAPVPQGLLVGPEGGFTPAELDALRACPFVLPVTLGPRILRAETAAIVGLALLQAEPAFL